MEVNLFGAYFEGAFLAAIASCFINGRISEQQIDVAKEIISRFKEYEIEHLLNQDSLMIKLALAHFYAF